MQKELPTKAVIEKLVMEAMAADAASLSGTQATAPKPTPLVRRVALGCDHGGLEMKNKLRNFIEDMGCRVKDFGTYTPDAVDYPDYARAVAEAVSGGEFERGVIVDGAGIGSCMAANKVKGVRAAMCYDLKTVMNSREHNDANVLTLGGKMIDMELAKEMVKAWLSTPFGGGRHKRRVDKIMAIEEG
jgi:ribose 5-phosphate isomerase B